MERERKLAIVAPGGGLACSYGVGSVLALVEKYNITSPEIAIGASGSAGTLAYYVSEQYGSIRNIWENLLSTEEFLNPKRLWRIMDIDYLIDQVFKKQDPLNVQKILNSPINFQIPYTNIKSGRVDHFSNRDGGDVFEALRATKAMPIIYGKSVNIGGQYYCDTQLSASSAWLIDQAKRLGAEKVLVLDNKPDQTTQSNPIIKNGFDIWLYLRSKQFRKNYLSELKRLGGSRFGGPVYYLKPTENIRVSTLTNNRSLLKEAIESGYRDAVNDPELKPFLEL